jgi:hypothetical protein
LRKVVIYFERASLITYPLLKKRRKRKKWYKGKDTNSVPSSSILQIPGIFETCFDGVNNDKDDYNEWVTVFPCGHPHNNKLIYI